MNTRRARLASLLALTGATAAIAIGLGTTTDAASPASTAGGSATATSAGLRVH